MDFNGALCLYVVALNICWNLQQLQCCSFELPARTTHCQRVKLKTPELEFLCGTGLFCRYQDSFEMSGIEPVPKKKEHCLYSANCTWWLPERYCKSEANWNWYKLHFWNTKKVGLIMSKGLGSQKNHKNESQVPTPYWSPHTSSPWNQGFWQHLCGASWSFINK